MILNFNFVIFHIFLFYFFASAREGGCVFVVIFSKNALCWLFIADISTLLAEHRNALKTANMRLPTRGGG